MAIDPLSGATRTAKRNLIISAYAAIVTKTFNLTVSQVPLGGVVISLNSGAVNFILVSCLLYFLISFAVYYWIDIKNIEVTAHQKHASELFKEKGEGYIYEYIQEIRKTLERMAPERCLVIAEHHKLLELLNAKSLPVISPNTEIRMGVHYPFELEKTTPGARVTAFSKLEYGLNKNIYDPMIKELAAWHAKYKWVRVLHWIKRWPAYSSIRLLYVFRNYGFDGILPVMIGVLAFLVAYDVISLEWIRSALPKSPVVVRSTLPDVVSSARGFLPLGCPW